MTVRVECDGDDCTLDILESNGFQLIEGEVIVDAGSETLEQDEYHGVFCSQECLINYLKNRDNSEQDELVKQAAISKLESKVEEDGVPEVWEPGETWKPVLEEVREELVETDLISEDVSLRKIYEYTQECREQLLEQENGGENE